MPTFSIKLARSFAQQGDYGKSIANWFAVLKCQPALKSALKLEFLDCLSQFICDLEKRNRRDQAVDYFLMAQQLYPDCSEIFVLWGQFLFRNELMEESTFCFCKALDLEPMNFRARQNLRNLSSHVIDQWHFRMLNDTARNFAYERAISMALCNSSSGMVLDIGAGTGLLSMLALLAGATSVFACEMSKPMVDVARRVLSDNKMEEKILLINKISTDILVDHDIPQQKVSLVISEIMDAGLYGEGILPTLLDAKKRLLRPGGILIPNRAKIYGMLVQSDEIRRSVSVKSSRNSQYPVLVSEYTQEAVRLSSSGDPYVSEYMSKTPFTPLSRNFQLDEICFNDLNSLEQHSDNFNLTLTIPVTTAGRLDGVVSWFEVELYDGITLQTGIGTDTMWEQAVYPCGREINVLPNSSVNLQVRLCAKNRLELLVVDADHNDGQLQVAKTALIRKMNDLKLFDFYQNSFNTADVIPELLDLSDLPMVSELALKRGWKTTVITDSEELFEACLKDRLPTEALKNVTINSSEYIEHLSSPVSLITVDLADSMGTLKPKCLEDLAFCRLKLGVEAVVPSKLTVYGKLVESSELWGWTCVTDDRNTLGLKIRDRINVFQTNLQLDVPKGISREFKGLSEAQQLLQLDLCEKLLPNSESLPKFVKQDAKVTMQVTDGGQLHAVLLWFQYQSGPAVLDTLQAESFHQAAYMLDGTTVSQGFNVELLVNLANSEIAVELVK